MSGSPVEDGTSDSFTQVSYLSLNHDFSNLVVQQTLTGGVGTAYYCDNTTSTSFASGSGILTPISSNSPVSYDPPFAATTDTSPPETPGSDQDSDSSDTSGPKKYTCDYPGCKTKKVFRRPCELR
jgi:hypothetical protein